MNNERGISSLSNCEPEACRGEWSDIWFESNEVGGSTCNPLLLFIYFTPLL